MADLEVLHTIDKRLAVLEAMSEQHSMLVKEQLSELSIDVKKIASEMVSLKIKVAGISMFVSLLTAGGVKWLSPFLQ